MPAHKNENIIMIILHQRITGIFCLLEHYAKHQLVKLLKQC